jgi:hypothetical protein
MALLFISRIYTHPDPRITLRDVWWLAENELNAAGELTEKLIESDDDLARLHRNVSWLSQAIIEFVDLLGLHFPRTGRWTHTNYLFYEALSALRESAVTGLNGSTRASLSTLRSSMEMFLSHCWWQERLFLEKSFEPFYDWLEGKKASPPFKNIVQANFRSLQLPKSDLTFEQVYDTYRTLCSYVHAPLLHESITAISGSNRPSISTAVSRYWMEITQITLRIVLEHLIFHKPQSLFPVDINRKFAFSPPVGMFFDELNIVPLRAALGEEMVEMYRTAAKEIQLVKDVMNFYQSQPDLSDEQILRMWDKLDDGEFGERVPKDIQSRWVVVKARMRVVNMALSYMATEEARALSL